MENFWDSNVWGTYLLIGILLASLLLANILKRKLPFLRNSLIPNSVLGGILILVLVAIYKLCSGVNLFDAEIFGGRAYSTMEVLTYHCLALGFIASALKSSDAKLTKERSGEIFNTGVTTVATYLLQAVVGFGITMIAAKFFIDNFFPAAGVLLPFGFGQGTGQAMNYGTIYETQFGFEGGKTFGLTIAALGFLSASIGGVIHLNILKRKGIVAPKADESLNLEKIEEENEIPMQESIDKLTVQVAIIAVAYMLAYVLMYLLGLVLPGMKSVIYGFNFLLGVLAATVVKAVLKLLQKTKLMHRNYTNNFLLTRTSNFFFDLMVVAGVAAIRLDILENYWGIMLVLGIVGLVITYAYEIWIAKLLFPKYAQEQFLMMYGMLTGTASTGTILLRELDPEFKTPAADNMVYQNFPAIVFGFPIMLLATLAPEKPGLTWELLFAFFIVMNVILFRKFIFKKSKAKAKAGK